MLFVEIFFLPLKEEDLPLLHFWLQEPHVKEFWNDGYRTIDQVKLHYFSPQKSADNFTYNFVGFVIKMDKNKIGYIQAYEVGDKHPYHPFGLNTTYGVDLFIGDKTFLGKGFSKPIIESFIAFLKEQHPSIDRIIIDPEPRNSKAIHIYKKCGFELLDEMVIKKQKHLIFIKDIE